MTSSIEIRQDSFAKHWQQLTPTFKEHFKECGIPGVDDAFELQIDKLKLWEEYNYLVCIGAFDGDEVVGYVCNVLNEHPFFNNKVSATTVAFYVKPEYRNGLLGLKMVKHSIKILKDHYNVDWYDLIANTNIPLGKFPERMGFVKSDIVYRKKLGV